MMKPLINGDSDVWSKLNAKCGEVAIISTLSLGAKEINGKIIRGILQSVLLRPQVLFPCKYHLAAKLAL
jgi:hypothetical protein